MNTETIITELRLYNRWRRGDEAITAPDPTALGKLLDDAADRIEHLFASGIHTCHADCQRPMCVLRRERDKALADLAALRARVAELEERAERYRLTTLRQDARNAELVAALTTATNELQRATVVTDGHPSVSHNLMLHLREVIARAESPACQNATNGGQISSESVTPSKHPDTELLEWLFCNTIIAGPDGHVIDCRDDADTARKQGGSND